jgi:CHAD domain-containing protein
LSSALGLIFELYASEYIPQALKILKKQLKSFNELRDTQVQMIKLGKLIYKFPVLYSYYNYQKNNEFNLILILKEKILNFSAEDLEGLIFFLKMDLKREIAARNFSTDDLLRIGESAYNVVIEKVRNVDTSLLDTIHKVRLAFKKFRYIMEILKPIAGWKKKKYLSMKEIQDILGNIQDNRVFSDTLNEYVFLQNDIPVTEFQLIKEYIAEERQKLIEELTGRFPELAEFKILP